VRGAGVDHARSGAGHQPHRFARRIVRKAPADGAVRNEKAEA